MRVCRNPSHGGGQEMDLADVVTPHNRAYECSGALEEATALANKNAVAIGKLIELLVDRRTITLDEALRLVDCYDEVVPV